MIWYSVLPAEIKSISTARLPAVGLGKIERDFVGEIAAQFRPGELLAQVNFSHYSVYTEYGFSTDISETCLWITPIVKDPPVEDKQDFRYSKYFNSMDDN